MRSFFFAFGEDSARIRRGFFRSASSKNAARTSIRISGNPYRPVYSRILKNRNCSFQMLTTQKIQIYYYFEFPTRHPYKICWFEFWVRRPKRLLVAATAARFRGGGGRGGGDHGGEGRGGGGLCGGGVAAAGSKTRSLGHLKSLKFQINHLD